MDLIKVVQSIGREIRYASVNEKYLCLSCELYNNNKDGALEVIDI
jgi:hypothetical protein